MPADTLTAIATTLAASLLPRRTNPVPATSATTDLAKQLDILSQELSADSTIHPAYRKDLETILSSAVQLCSQLANPSFNFDRVLEDYTRLQTTLAAVIRHAAVSRPRINGWGLTHNDKVFPYFAMSGEEAARMRDGIGTVPLNVVTVEIIHSSGFQPPAPPAPSVAPVSEVEPTSNIPEAPAPIPVLDAASTATATAPQSEPATPPREVNT